MSCKATPSSFRQSGVTLVELIVTMAIAGILLSIGVSSYRYITRSNRSAGEINALLGDMTFARYEAVKEGLPVRICPASSASATTCDANPAWSEGWIVLANAASATGAIVLRRQLPFSSFSSTDTLTGPTTNEVITFNREGFATGLNAVVVFSLHDFTVTASYTRCLMLGASGVLQTALATSQSGQTVMGQNCT
jgi:type IV fimbrial biogenesis protein FimT